MSRAIVLAAIAVIASAGLSGCDSVGDDGPREVLVTQAICENVNLLRLRLGETNRVILDNTRQNSENQNGLSLTLERFPMFIVGEVPPNTETTATFTTVPLSTQPGETAQVDVEPTFTGTYDGVCRTTIRQGASGTQVIERIIRFELVG